MPGGLILSGEGNRKKSNHFLYRRVCGVAAPQPVSRYGPGQHGSGVLVTLAQRKARMYLVRKVEAKRATDVRDAIIDMRQPYASHAHTITADNGSEFVDHKEITEALNTDIFFAHPYSL